MINIKNKKGSQVAIVLSIVIFIGFFIFLYILLMPKVAVENNKNIVANLLNYKLIDELSVSLTTVTLVLEEDYNPQGKDCIGIDHISGVNGLNSSARDGTGSLDSFSDSEKIMIDFEGSNEFFKIYYTEASFTSTPSPEDCNGLEEGEEYELGLIKTTQEVFESKILDYIGYYDEDYGDLKEELDLSSGKEFYFNFTYDDGTSVSPTEKDTYGSLYVQRRNIEYIDLEANKKIGVLEVWIW